MPAQAGESAPESPGNLFEQVGADGSEALYASRSEPVYFVFSQVFGSFPIDTNGFLSEGFFADFLQLGLIRS